MLFRSHTASFISVLAYRSPIHLGFCHEHFPKEQHSILARSPCPCWSPSTTGTLFFRLPSGISSCSQTLLAYSTPLAVEVVCASVYVAVHPGELQRQTQIPKATSAHHGTTPFAAGASTTAISRQRATLMATADQRETQAQTITGPRKTWVPSTLSSPQLPLQLVNS